MSNFRQIFGIHANEILHNPKYSNWRCIEPGKPGMGIEVFGPDKAGILRTWRITPTPDYPSSPPTVVAEPVFTDDPCWRNGYLNFNMVPWKRTIDRGVINPLHELMMELLRKYRAAV
ncbi:hypothetical protein ANRL3_02542 [Anaerolineae bacterium]|nr:hypothetical protein ANRL3_02542 [Anaerolineae bacterium]